MTTRKNIMAYLKRAHHLMIGEATLDGIQQVLRVIKQKKIRVHGRSLKNGRRVTRWVKIAELL